MLGEEKRVGAHDERSDLLLLPGREGILQLSQRARLPN
jgi:hypothetical protein